MNFRSEYKKTLSYNVRQLRKKIRYVFIQFCKALRIDKLCDYLEKLLEK